MSTGAVDSELIGPIFARPQFTGIFSDRHRLQAMLDVEAALARAEAICGVIPQGAATTIAEKCQADLFDIADLGEAAAKAGNPVIPMVKMLTALAGKEAGRYVHWGATTQDIVDTALLLQLRILLRLADAELCELIAALCALARKHRDDPMAGRTFMQQALPVTFGLRAAGWLSPLLRARQRLGEMKPRLFALQFGGAAGTLASLGAEGLRVQEALAGQLDLAMPDIPWHSARDRFAELAGECALIAGTLAKIAGDIALLSQTEIGELAEPAEKGRGSSSTMPQKRNPVAAIAILAACEKVEALFPLMNRSMAADHERGTGSWHAEWLALPEIAVLTASALAAMHELAGNLEVDTVRMRENLDLTSGLIMSEAVMMALAPALGRLAAHDLVAHAGARATAEGRHLKDILAEDARAREALSTEGIDDLFDPASYIGQGGAFIDRVLAEAAVQEHDATARKGGND